MPQCFAVGRLNHKGVLPGFRFFPTLSTPTLNRTVFRPPLKTQNRSSTMPNRPLKPSAKRRMWAPLFLSLCHSAVKCQAYQNQCQLSVCATTLRRFHQISFEQSLPITIIITTAIETTDSDHTSLMKEEKESMKKRKGYNIMPCCRGSGTVII